MLVDGLRPLWLQSIAEVDGSPAGRLSDWVGDGQYYFDGPVGPSAASFVLAPGSNLLHTFAAEMSRFSSAAIETSIGIAQPGLPKSTAWLFIQAYYAAFYAAHCILRSVGISASNFKTGECQKADTIAAALGFGGAPLNASQFRCEYNIAAGRLDCVKAAGPGIHEQFWRVFDAFLLRATNEVLKNPVLTTSDAQAIFSKLRELQSTLRLNGHHNGNWLSSVRNEVTYMHKHSAWFPYGRNRAGCDRLFVLQRQWCVKPDEIVLSPAKATDAEIFIIVCAFLVSLSVAVVRDMAARNPVRDSFLLRGPLKLLSQAAG
jgi:hypothetical protein